ncbi:c-type cytochrome [Vibrio coralliilyticus]|uniref:c-type cytochrome n=1 Tax=Vibrio coralliilyticus TaxID=190893 RepID=UPI00031C6390|nr:cytochrome c [Vibrio coralliilyticus]AIS57586.1 cytochrome C [Vibrio coralliilyticus]MCC2520780.1 cytochrome c [Vibrio coralliilyticus]NRF61227.1 cytochrome c [Vibrio coralliilyticus]WFB49581.1 cytochrome c [Vibrio coralliilyticus]
MKKILIGLAVVLPLTAIAQDFSQQITERQNAFEDIESTSKLVNKTLNGRDTDWSKLENQSQKLANHSQTLLTLFPQGSHVDSKAKPEIWSKPDKFNQLLTQMDQGFQDLYQASQNKDIKMAESGLESAQDTCRSCHRSYRSRW